MNKTIIVVSVIALIIVGSIVAVTVTKNKNSENLYQYAPHLGDDGIGVTLYDANGQPIKTVSDETLYALYKVNDFENVHSLSISGKICAKEPYFVTFNGVSDSEAVEFAIDLASLSGELGKDGQGRSVAQLQAGQCASFKSAPIVADEIGEGTYDIYFLASASRQYANGEIGIISEQVESNHISMTLEKTADGIDASVVIEGSDTQPTVTTTTVKPQATTTTVQPQPTTTTVVVQTTTTTQGSTCLTSGSECNQQNDLCCGECLESTTYTTGSCSSTCGFNSVCCGQYDQYGCSIISGKCQGTYNIPSTEYRCS